MLDRYFKLAENGTTVRTEVLAGITTFLTMAYIVFVNPAILADAGIDRGAAFVATCLAAAIGTAIMGLYANYPVALAPGMGLNAYFTYGVVLGMGHSWQVALGAVFVSGVLFLILSVLPIREKIINSIPTSQKFAIGAGIGLFLGLIGLKNAGIVVDNPATLVALGKLTVPTVGMAILGFFIIAVLDHRKIPGAIMISILGVTVLGILFGLSPFGGIASAPPSLAPTLLQMDISGALSLGLLTIVFAFLMVDLFDTAGTLVAVAPRAGLLEPDGKLKRLGKALVADSTATIAGAALGTSTTTSYIESAAGIRVGGRTGLTAVVVAILFVLAIFFAPLAGSIPAYATAPALIFVACVMTSSLARIDWEDITEYLPAVITAVMMPFTFSIATGIGLGFITYVVLKALTGKGKDIHPVMAAVAIIFAIKFIFV
ncbi:NCS2 family permease [uncultured Ferrovibrio sp.]|jgi:AGZA family xanthine/uracil permease-like MFS transporter|uniref:NCS2 family permease n=1 Tax=uncultured Ferrovibrio sp. TaxID=1576913 RepID=UPI002615E4B4|nr:NCS2 family permease [uncultured Ferrovibrio sp.]